jgi:Tol biopolymer transport system component
MRKVKIVISVLLIAVFVALNGSCLVARELNADSVFRIKMKNSDELYPAWSADGTRLVFQSNRYGNNDIFLYDFLKDTVLRLTNGKADEQHPVFMPESNSVAFDSRIGNKVYLFKIDTVTGRKDVLFTRKLFCEAPSFSPSGRLVVFKGYDRNSETWQIFSYDFVYDNLNRLTHYTGKKVSAPVFSPNGKVILFGLQDKEPPYKRSMEEINWYGERVCHLDSVRGSSYCWSDAGFRIIYSDKQPDSVFRLLSVRSDGTSTYILLDDRFPKFSPALSPDGSKLAVAVKFENDFDIVIIKVTDE